MRAPRLHRVLVTIKSEQENGLDVKTPLKTFEPNFVGRDFVVGDLHGSLSCFERLLEGLHFDAAKDRIFSVGDLVDRGPNSLECLELLKNPWFHAVLANHEQMMLEAFDGGYMGQFWLQNGGFWGYSAFEDHRKMRSSLNELEKHVPHPDSIRLFEVMQLVRELPFLMTIAVPDGRKFHVLHAELPPGYAVTDTDLSSPGRVLELAQTRWGDGDSFVWGRFIYAQFHGADLSNIDKVKRSVAYNFASGSVFNDKLSHILSGHTIMHRPLTILGQTNLDTQAYGCYRGLDRRKWNALTCVQLDTWKFYQATPEEFREVEPLTVNKADIEALRGQPQLPVTTPSNLKGTWEL